MTNADGGPIKPSSFTAMTKHIIIASSVQGSPVGVLTQLHVTPTGSGLSDEAALTSPACQRAAGREI